MGQLVVPEAADRAPDPCQHPLQARQPLLQSPAGAAWRWRCLSCDYLQPVDCEDPEPPPPAWLVSWCSACSESWTVDVALGQLELEWASALGRLHLIDMHDDPWPMYLLRQYISTGEGAL
jgi:hypothetical protein